MNTKNRQTNLYYAPAAVSYKLSSASEKIKYMVAFLYDTELNDVKVEMYHIDGNLYQICIIACDSYLPIFADELISNVKNQFTNYFGEFVIEHFHAAFDAEDFIQAPLIKNRF